MIEWIAKGGWFMLPLVLFSVVSIAVALERLFALSSSRVLSPEVLSALEEGRSAKDIGQLLEKDRTVMGRFLTRIRQKRDEPKDFLSDLAHSYFKNSWNELERNLEILNIVATASPLLGLLGTVSGLIQIFQAVTRFGLGNPAILSGGIAEALITTITGLVIAVPALIFYTYFTKRVEKYLITFEECGKLYIETLKPAYRIKNPMLENFDVD